MNHSEQEKVLREYNNGTTSPLAIAKKVYGEGNEIYRKRVSRFVQKLKQLTPYKFDYKLEPKNECVFVISDMHAPYHHKDTLAFLEAVKNKYQPDRVVCIGDELDYHAVSFHESDPDLDSAGMELKKGREFLWKVEKIFPVMDLVESNHGSLVYRKALNAGLPQDVLLGYRDIIFSERSKDRSLIHTNRGQGWKWHERLIITLSDGMKCTFCHDRGSNAKNIAGLMNTNYVQGHHHSIAEIGYVGNDDNLRFGMTVGCLIDDKAFSFRYNKIQSKRPIISCGIIINGKPMIIPMVLDHNRNWIGTL